MRFWGTRSRPPWPVYKTAGPEIALTEPSFTFGIKKEYLLIDAASRDLVSEPAVAMLDACRTALGGAVAPEILRSQIEVATGIHQSPDEVRAQFADLGGTVGRVLGAFDCAPVAAGRRPTLSGIGRTRNRPRSHAIR